MDDVAVVITDDLDFDVAWLFDVLFEVDAGVFEGFFGFSTGCGNAGAEGDFIPGDSHALTTATGGGFDQYGVADAVGDLYGIFDIRDQSIAAGDTGHTGFAGDFASTDFVTELLHGFNGWADEFDVAAAADFGEVGIFCEETVAGMHGLYVSDFRCTDDAFDLEVAFERLRGPDAPRFVGKRQVVSAAVGFAVDRDGLNSHLAAGADDSQGNFAAIGNQNSLKHE